jgi:phosphoribosylaminoimidazole-succinocarboxamide synthase
MRLGEGRGYLRSGKVRDLYELPDRRLVLVASDRISAFDVVLPSMIPDKGRVLTGLSRFWFAETAGIVPNHLLDTDVAVIDDAIARSIEVTGSSTLDLDRRDELRGRVMICRPTTVFPIEAVVRGYLAGSGWKEYQAAGSVCGVALPAGLRESDRLPEPIFTPATKAEAGEHDQNISFDGMVRRLKGPRGRVDGGEIGDAIREHALRLYRYAAAMLEVQGILLADTKFEFGLASNDGAGEVVGPPGERIVEGDPLGRVPDAIPDWPLGSRVLLIDEALTPDSSRFWDASTYQPGQPQASFDKQFVRDWLEVQPWDKTAPGPALPDEVVDGTRARYVEAYERITGASFERYLREDLIAS